MSVFAIPEVWVAIGFVAMIAIFIYAGAPRMVTRSLDARAAAIRAELDEARRLREEAAMLLQSYRAKAGEAEKEAKTIVADAKVEAERFAVEARAHLKSQLGRRTQMAHEKIAQAEAKAMAEIRAVAADTAAAAAERLIAARLDERRASTIVAQSIGQLPEKL